MEGFPSSFHSFKPSTSFTLTDIDQNMELLDHQYSNHYHHDMNHQNMIMSSQAFMGGFSNDNFFSPSVDHQYMQCLQPVFDQHEQKNVVVIPGPVSTEPVVNGKRKSMDVSSSSSGNSSSYYPVQESEIDEKKYQRSIRKGKKVKASDSSSDAPKDVVHVRARRGQATDSHSVAERVRRGKINERFRCLQDIVPGCYKSMGMAVMLDEIINYVQSLQNQVEFLSLKLTEASSFPNLDPDLSSINAFQMENMIEGIKMQRVEERGQVDQSFGSYPSLPYHTT